MKNGKIIFLIFKVAIVIASVGYIGFKLYVEKNNGVLFNDIQNIDKVNYLYLFLSVLLMPLNWLLESIKFKLLVKPLQKLSLLLAIKAVLAGITVSIFTPKRIGDFGGRIFVLETKNRLAGIFATLLGSIAQLITTLIMGIVFLPVYFIHNKSYGELNININFVFLSSIVVITGFLFVYLNVTKIGNLLCRIKFVKKFEIFFQFVKKYTLKELLSFLVLSCFRYAIFLIQFYVLLTIFGIEASFMIIMVALTQIYFITTLIPTIALGELGVRGSVAVWVLGNISTASSSIISASILLWILNLAIPALIGIYYLSKLKY